MARSTKAQMEARKDAIFDFCNAQHPVTVRGIYYHLMTKGLVPKTENGYKKVQVTCANMRLDGELPWYFIADNSRPRYKLPSQTSVQDALQDTVEWYRRDFLNFTGQEIEVWLEKDALAGVIKPVTHKWDIPLIVSRGCASLTQVYTAAEMLSDGAIVYILSDYDAAGVVIGDSIEQRFREFTDKQITVKRPMLTQEQVEAWNLPKRDPKPHDRKKGFDYCVELDAIPPEQLRSEVESYITEQCSAESLKLLRSIEAEERASIESIFSYQQETP